MGGESGGEAFLFRWLGGGSAIVYSLGKQPAFIEYFAIPDMDLNTIFKVCCSRRQSYMPLQTIVNGLLLGGVFALVAVGFSLIFGVMDVLNLTHGATIILGSYLSYYAWDLFGIDPFLLIPIVLVSFFGLGYIYQQTIIRRILGEDELVTLLVTFGFALMIRNALTIFATSNSRSINLNYASDALTFGAVAVPIGRVLVLVTSIVLIGALILLLEKTEYGTKIRAAAQDDIGAQICGINVDHTYAMTFGVATALAGVSGTLIAVIIPFDPSSETLWTLRAFIIVVLGGLGSPLGALLGGFLLGLVSSFTAVYIGATYTEMAMFLVLVLMLFVRPQGLLGETTERVT